jgi:hypothetical protein
MDQVKEILRQAIKYRFWIAVGISALLPLIAYFSAAGSLQAETDTETKKIEQARDGVKPYVSGPVVNKDYAPEVDKRTEVLKKDVNAAWKKLYDRQAPLLTWPDEVSERFITWGRRWPEGVDPALIADTINTYIKVYDVYVDNVYQSFRPFDYETGKGVVAAPDKQSLLQPKAFIETAPPDLTTVWEAQQRLWVQRTVLDAINQVNHDAKDWDGATIKQIVSLQVASSAAQDQKSLAKGEVLEPAPAITDPSAPAATTAATPAAAPAGAAAPAMGAGAYGKSGGGMTDLMSGFGKMAGGGMMGGGGGQTVEEPFQIIKPKNPTQLQQFQIVPVYVSVYIDQTRIPELIVGFQNSPMTIQVLDFEWQRPEGRVKKPVMGDKAPQAMMGMMGGYPGMKGGGMSEMILGMGGGGGMSSGMMMRGGYGGNMSEMMSGMRGMGMPGGMGYGGGGTRRTLPEREIRKGEDAREEVRKRIEEQAKKKKAQKKEGDETDEEAAGQSKDAEEKEQESAAKKQESSESRLNDPYFNIIEVRLYGQARFYNTPPVEPAPPQSQAETAAAPPAAPAEDAAKPAEPKSESPKDEAAKPADDATGKAVEPAKKEEEAKPEDEEKAKDEAKAKNEAAKPAGEAEKGEPAKKKKDEAPKADASQPKDEAAKKDEAPKR